MCPESKAQVLWRRTDFLPLTNAHTQFSLQCQPFVSVCVFLLPPEELHTSTRSTPFLQTVSSWGCWAHWAFITVPWCPCRPPGCLSWDSLCLLGLWAREEWAGLRMLSSYDGFLSAVHFVPGQMSNMGSSRHGIPSPNISRIPLWLRICVPLCPWLPPCQLLSVSVLV